MSDGLLIRSSHGDYAAEFTDAEQALKAEPQSCFFIIDESLAQVQRGRLAGLASHNRLASVAADETVKTAEQALVIIEKIVATGFRRNERLVAIGGGVVQDLTGFIASILYRGVEWAFYPTTLVAQADSCIGGKTSINMRGSKNLLGTFNPPRRITIDTGFLDTLPSREIRSGIGEMLHYFLFEGFEQAEAIAAAYDELLTNPRRLAPFVRASLEIKKQIVEVDEFDRGVRSLFNYGHTFGHALEVASEYAVSHGEAVTWGMDLANELSSRLGLLDLPTLERMRAVLTPNVPSYALPEERLPMYFAALSRDKKNTGSTLGCILTRGPGRMEKVQLPIDDQLRGTITDYISRARAAVAAP
jgi:3-dehydroquinate synthase